MKYIFLIKPTKESLNLLIHFSKICYKASFLVMDKKYRLTGNDTYSYLKYYEKLTLALYLFCWNEINKKKSLPEISAKLIELGVWDPQYIEEFSDIYADFDTYRRTKNPLLKLEFGFSGVKHAEGYYKLRELENKYGSSVLRDVFLGKYDNEFPE